MEEVKDLRIATIGNVDAGKCLGVNTPVLMYSGEIRYVQNIKNGDILMGDDGHPRFVRNITEGVGELYKVKQDCGDDYVINNNHILSLLFQNPKYPDERIKICGRKYRHGNVVDIEIFEYLALSRSKRNYLHSYKTEIQYRHNEVPIDPYIIGYQISRNKIFTSEYHTFGKPLEFIPDNYKYNSISIRSRLIAGLIDSEGSYNILKQNDRLTNDIKYVVSSLGLYCKIDDKFIRISSNRYLPCQLVKKPTRTQQLFSKHFKPTTKIVIKKHGYGKFYGFELDSNQRFLLGDFTVTHNSTIVGVLTKGILDDGKGLARSYILNHEHERRKGQTSSISMELMGFDSEGKHVVPANPSKNIKERRLKDYKEVSVKSKRKVVFVDLCGHQKYLKTTLTGLCGYIPDYSMVIISANNGTVPRMTLEHMNMSFVLGIPFFIVLTKIDMAPKQIYEETVKQINKLSKRYKQRATDEDFIIPVFEISNKTGEGIDKLKEYINELSKNLKPIKKADPNDIIDYVIENKYQVPGVGIVVGGYLTSGTIKEGQILMLGPNNQGTFDKIRVQSIQRQCIPTKEIHVSQQSTIAIKFVDLKKADKHNVRKGSHITSETVEIGKITREFEANVKILKHSTTIKEGYESTMHIGNIRQTAKILKIYEDTVKPNLIERMKNMNLDLQETKTGKNNVLRMGCTGKIRFKFLMNEEYLKLGMRFVFREGNCRGTGTIVKLY